MTISEHLEELRSRLLRGVVAVLIGFVIAFWQIDWVIAFLSRPLDSLPADLRSQLDLIQSKPYGAFVGAMKLAFFAGLVGASPIILHQLWAFVAAGLYRTSGGVVKFYAIPGFLLFLSGAYLAWAFVMPWALQFLVGFAQNQVGVRSLLEFSDFVGLIAFAMFMFGLMFQLPVVMVFLMRLGVVEPAFFRRFRKHAILVAFTIGMVLTPPDVISQIALASCLIVLYEGAILVGARSRSGARRPPDEDGAGRPPRRRQDDAVQRAVRKAGRAPPRRPRIGAARERRAGPRRRASSGCATSTPRRSTRPRRSRWRTTPAFRPGPRAATAAANSSGRCATPTVSSSCCARLSRIATRTTTRPPTPPATWSWSASSS